MSDGRDGIKLRNLVSPLGMALLSFAFFLFAWLFPPSLYVQMMHEPDFMFMNWKSLCFCSLCIAAFLLGTRITRFTLGNVVVRLFGVRLGPQFAESQSEISESSTHIHVRTLYLLLPIIVSIFLGCVTLAVVGLKTDSVSLLLDAQAQLIKDTNADPVNLSFWGKLIPLAPVHMAIIWWFAYRLQQVKLTKRVRRWSLGLLWLAVVVAISNSIAHAERVTLMPILVGLFPVYFFTSKKVQSGKIWSVLKPMFLGLAAIMGLFFFVALLRGNPLDNDTGQLLLGYTFSSYNRLAAALDGTLRYSYAGNVQDLCWFCSSNKYFNAIVPYATIFHIPDAITTWAADFSDTGSAGLIGSYTFASVFAYVFRDIGWWAPLFFTLQGIIVGSAWRSFKQGRVFGLMLYPWCAFSVLFWFGFNIFFNDALFYIAISSIFLRRYEKSTFGAADDILSSSVGQKADSPA